MTAELLRGRISLALVYLDAVTHHPKIELFEPGFPASFELFHPLVISSGVGYINDELHEIVSINNATVAPMPFQFLRFVIGGAEVIHDF